MGIQGKTTNITSEEILSGLSAEALGYFYPGLETSFLEDLEEVVSTLISDDDARIRALRRELRNLKNRYGATDEDIEKALSYNVKLSKLVITNNYDIFLGDYGHKEVRMDQLAKTVYILFLKHPEGIRLKDITDYRQEIEEIYTKITDRDNLDAIRRSIDDLVDTISSNSLNEKISRSKKAFRNLIDKRIACNYYIVGEKGSVKKIALDNKLVVWE